MALAMLLTLWFATHSARTTAAIAITIVAGLVITLAGGLAAAGSLNVISIAFIPLFVGLGVDFGIQVTVRFNAERWAGAELRTALERAAVGVGAPILLAAGAICLALVAFLPTDYIGLAELGIISAFGMVVALVLNLTFLPALLVLLKPAAPAAQVGYCLLYTSAGRTPHARAARLPCPCLLRGVRSDRARMGRAVLSSQAAHPFPAPEPARWGAGGNASGHQDARVPAQSCDRLRTARKSPPARPCARPE